jgi:8-amino-7-oxononanoate synthase
MMQEGRHAFGPPPPDRWDHGLFFSPSARAADRYYAPNGAFLDDVRRFAAMEFAIPPRRVEVMDPQQRLALECAWVALQDAGYAASLDRAEGARPLDRRTVATYLGITALEWRTLLSARVVAQLMAAGALGQGAGDDAEAALFASAVERVVPSRAFAAPGILSNMSAAVVAQELDLGGPAFTIDAACASALVAVHDGILALRAGVVDTALAGGVYVNLLPDHLIGFSRIGAISAGGVCRPFDAAADGFVQGEGVGFVVLKRLDDALAADDRIYAVIRGTACNNDGRGDGPMSPRMEGQEEVIRAAWADASLDPGDIGYVEAHGTGTTVGDRTELAALRRCLGSRARPVSIGSAKANVGHTMSAAGIAGLLRAALAVHHRSLPPLANWSSPHPDLDAAAFDVPTAPRPWDGRRMATVSSFGFGGTNAHVVLDEAPATRPTRLFAAARPAPPLPAALVVVSADDGALLARHAAELADALDGEFPAIVHTLNLGRRRRAVRVAMVARTRDELRSRLRSAAEELARNPGFRGTAGRDVVIGDASRAIPVAFLCPGQGMQRVGMLRDWREIPEFEASMAASEAAVADVTPRPLREYLWGADATEEALTDTAIAQPAMLAIGLAVAATLARFGVEPSICLGHSLGEFTASVLSGAASARDALRFVALRGRAMSDMAGEHGGMAAVMAAAPEVEPHLATGVVLANRNHPRQNVISGPVASVDETVRALAAAGIKARRIPVSHAFHSPMLEEVQPDVDRGLRGVPFASPDARMASCIAAERPATAEDVRRIWRRHATSPVDFVRGLEQCRSAGARIVLQLAPGATLTAFARGVLTDGESIVSVGPEEGDGGLGLLRVLALCAANGHRVDLGGFGEGLASLPPPPLRTEVYWAVKASGGQAPVLARASGAAEARVEPEVHAPGPPGEADLEARVLGIVARVSAFPVEALRTDQKLLEDLGFDSLMANELSTRLVEAFPGFAGIPRALLATGPTLADLVAHVEHGGEARPLTDPDRPLTAHVPTLVEAPLGGLEGPAARILRAPTLEQLRRLTPGPVVVAGRVLSDDAGEAAIAGFVKALAREWPEHKVVLVEGDEAALEAEAHAAERDPEVRWRDGRRFVVGLREVAPASREVGGQTVLVTGGAGWLGRRIARTLADAGASVVLMGTRADPGDALAELGAGARWVRGDVRGELPVDLHVDGVVHAAGVLADGPVGTADPKAAMAVKAGGLENLRRRWPEAWIVAIGSYAARFGNAGQTEYAAANDAMAGLARRLGVGVQVWGPWAGSDMVRSIPAAEQRAMRESGVWFVDEGQGMRALLANLGATGEVVLGLDLPDSRRVIQQEIQLDPALPWLRDHALLGRPTVPMAMVLEWAGRLGATCVEDLVLYEGLVVERPTKATIRREGARFTVSMGGRLCWEARLAQAAMPTADAGPVSGAPPLSLAEFYARHTFHGPALQGIEVVEALAKEAVCGIVRAGGAEAWGERDWRFSPLAIDAAFQLSAYWAHVHHGRAGFPVRVARWTQVGHAPRMRATLTFSQQTGDRFVGEVVLRDLDGRLLAVGEGVEAELRGGEVNVAEEFTDFAHFPQYTDLRQRLDAAGMMGIDIPYFKTLEGVARDRVRIKGRELLHFSGYNYLGFSGHPYVTRRVTEAVQRYGTSVSASRVASGQRPIHDELEARLAAALDVEAALVFTAGHATNVTTIGHLFGPKDLILHDELIHDSALQGMKLSGASRRPFAHGDMAALERILAQTRGRFEKCLVVVEGVYSMDGDICDLPACIALKRRFKTFLMVDEAHSFGVVGARGYGVREHFGVPGGEVDIWMGTLSKTLSSCGGYIAGRSVLVELLKYTAPGFVYSAGLTPANTMAALASLELMDREPEHVARLHANCAAFYRHCRAHGLDTGPAAGESAVVPVVVGNSYHALLLSDALYQRGVNVQPILYPAVADNASRLRFFLSSLHDEEQLAFTAQVTAEELKRIRAEGQAVAK